MGFDESKIVGESQLRCVHASTARGASAVRAQASQSCAAFRSAAVAARDFTRLFVILAAAHFLLDSSVFHQFPKPLHRVLNLFVISQTQLNHERPPSLQPPGNGISGSRRSPRPQPKNDLESSRNSSDFEDSEGAEVYAGLVWVVNARACRSASTPRLANLLDCHCLGTYVGSS